MWQAPPDKAEAISQGQMQTFTAVPSEGHSFVNFIVSDMASRASSEYIDNVISVTLVQKGTVVNAVYEGENLMYAKRPLF